MLIKTTIQAATRLEFYEPGDFFRLLDCDFPVDVTYYKNGQEIARAEGVAEGYAEKFERTEFDRWTISSATTQTLQFVARLGNSVNYDAPPTGSVDIKNKRGAFVQTTPTVTSASAQLLAANASRSYLLIQNNSTTGDIFVRLDGAAATTANGIRIPGNGGSYELQDYNPTGAVTAIGSIASNPNIVIVEG